MVVLLGISGISCSGKTTLSRLLRDIWPETFVIHEDDFYFEDAKIPLKQVGDKSLQDWDCLQAVDTTKLKECLEHIRREGKPPSDLVSKEDQNSVGELDVDATLVHAWKAKVAALRASSKLNYISIAIVDGFLLYAEDMHEIRTLLDLKILLRTSHHSAKNRREARSGYVTLEGFWQDPPGYVDDIVWPNYVKEHAFLFEKGNVEGEPDSGTCTKLNILVAPREAQQDMSRCLDWACTRLYEYLLCN